MNLKFENMNRIDYFLGEKIGECIFIEEVEPSFDPDGRKRRKATFKCKCGKCFISHINSVKNHLTKSCGCLNKTAYVDVNLKHGFASNGVIHKDYRVWSSAKNRCNNPNNKGYKNYGGRGIKMAEYWINNPEVFIEYIQKLPLYRVGNRSIDRINNDGDYEKGNLRWGTKLQQIESRRKKYKRNGKSNCITDK